jgi:YD repeat-containing protein
LGRNNTTTFQFDPHGDLTRVTDPLGNTVSTRFDPSNNPVEMTDPLGRITKTTYDSADRPLVMTDPRGKQVSREYDDNGNLVAFTDKMKNKTTLAYDENNRLIETTDALGRKAVNTRDALGRVTTFTNARGQQIQYTFDNDGRITGKRFKEDPAGGVEDEATYARDANGNVTQMGDDWGTSLYTYDASNRVTAITYPSGKSVSFTYNPSGLPATVTYPNGMVATYTYDNFNRLDSPTAGRSGPVVGNGEKPPQVLSLQMASGGNTRTISYSYNAAALPTLTDRPLTVADTSYTYDGTGMRVKRVVSGGATVQYHYGPGDQLLFTADGAGTVLACYVWKGSALAAMMVGNSVLTRPGRAGGLRYRLSGGSDERNL